MDSSSSCCLLKAAVHILAQRKSLKVLHLHPLGRRTLGRELLERNFPAGVGELQEPWGQAPEPSVFYPEWLETGAEFAHSHTGVLHGGSKEHIQGEVEFNILSRTECLRISCFGTVTEKPRLPTVLIVLSQCHPNWHLCSAPALPHFPSSAPLSTPSGCLLLPPNLAFPCPSLSHLDFPPLPFPKPWQQTWYWDRVAR